MFSKLSDKKLHLNSLSNQRKRKKQPPARFCDPEQIAKKSKVEASVIAKGHFTLESHFSKEHHRSKLHDLNSKSDQKSIESIDQPNRKSTNKLQDVKSIVCTNEIKLHKTVHEDETRKFQCEPEQIAKNQIMSQYITQILHFDKESVLFHDLKPLSSVCCHHANFVRKVLKQIL